MGNAENHRNAPNPMSRLLSRALVGGAGLAVPPEAFQPPPGMGAILLYVPLEDVCKNPLEIQADLGIPWNMGGQPYWFDQEG